MVIRRIVRISKPVSRLLQRRDLQPAPARHGSARSSPRRRASCPIAPRAAQKIGGEILCEVT